MMGTHVPPRDPRVIFVGAEAYAAAGGPPDRAGPALGLENGYP